MKPKISVVTVTYNAAAAIEKTLRSVASQTYDKLEYLIIDGGSKDGTLAIVDRWRDHIDYLVSEPDKGLYDAMNKGSFAATGDFVIMLNSDDVFVDEHVVEDVAAFIEAHPEADVIFGDTEEIWDYGTVRLSPDTAFGDNHKMRISPQATFARTALVQAYPFDLQYRYAADFAQFSAMQRAGNVFLRFDRLIARVEKRGGVTHDNHLASATEIYDILARQGYDVAHEKRRILRHIRWVESFKRLLPRWFTNPLLRLVAKYYKPL